MDSKDREVNELKTWAIRQLLYVIDSKTFSGFSFNNNNNNNTHAVTHLIDVYRKCLEISYHTPSFNTYKVSLFLTMI